MLNNNVKNRANIIAIGCIILFTLQLTQSFAQKEPKNKSLTKNLQSKATNVSSIAVSEIGDTSLKNNDTGKVKTIQKIDTLNISKDSLDAPVKYTAQDSGVLIIGTREFFLYGRSNVKYTTLSLDANVIKYDGSKQTVKAYGAMDTTNNPLNRTKMQDGENTTYSDTIDYNFKTQKGRTVNSYYTEGELFVNAQVLKKVDSNVFYGYKGRFTTCNLDTPHFAFKTKKLKMIGNKMAVSGPAFPEFEGVPLPIGIPFGIYPMNRGRHSGFIAPQFASSEDLGIGLQGLGYYKVINDNMDVLFKSDLYSYGSWKLSSDIKYIKRYRFIGNFSLTLMQNRTLNRSTTVQDEFTRSNYFQVYWRHDVDGKARPGTTFGANVNFSSTKYNLNNVSNPTNNYNNQTQSSINYSKNYNNKANLSLAFNHNQNANTRLVNLTLPNLNFSLQTIYPFQKKEVIGKAKWYENIGIGYSTNFSNTISFYDSTATFAKLIDTMRWHATHNIPISVALPALGPITISPSVSYGEEWWDREYYMQWNNATKKLDTTISKSFIRDFRTGFGLSLSTRIFGTVNFKGNKNIRAIRHEIRPTIGFNYTPNVATRNNFYMQTDTFGHVHEISKFTGSIVNPTTSGSMSFQLANSFELKVKNKKDTAANATKKIRLFDLNASTSYNLAADSFALGAFQLSFSSNAIEKLNFSANASIDPYFYDTTGYKTKQYAWQKNGFSLGRLTTLGISLGTQLRSKPIDDKKAKNKPKDPFLTADEQQRQLENIRNNPADYTDFNIPWSMTLNGTLTFNSAFNAVTKSYYYNKYAFINFNGDFNLSPKWKMGGSGNYNIITSKLESLTLFVSREMHCWQLSINVTPVNYWRSFSIVLNPKSGMLRDLKINRTRQYSSY